MDGDNLSWREYGDALIGLECWSVIGGTKDDLTLVLDMGNKQPRSLRLANRKLSFEQRTFEGSAGLFIQCPWRLESATSVIASCYDSGVENGPLADGWGDLEGQRVQAIETGPPGWDLSVRFENDRTLRAFCLEVDERRRSGNWFLWGDHGTLDVGPRSRMVIAQAVPEEEPPLETLAVVDPLDDSAEIKLWQARWRARRGLSPVNED